jgi:hypothetical protein
MHPWNPLESTEWEWGEAENLRADDLVHKLSDFYVYVSYLGLAKMQALFQWVWVLWYCQSTLNLEVHVIT